MLKMTMQNDEKLIMLSESSSVRANYKMFW